MVVAVVALMHNNRHQIKTNRHSSSNNNINKNDAHVMSNNEESTSYSNDEALRWLLAPSIANESEININDNNNNDINGKKIKFYHYDDSEN